MADKIADQVKILWQNKSLDELQAIANRTDPSIWSTETEVQAAREIIMERTNEKVTINKAINISQNLPTAEKREDSDVESMRKEKDWFIVIKDENDVKCFYNKEEIDSTLRANILSGKHRKNNKVEIHSKTNEGKWNKTDSTLLEFAKSHFKLRILYQPVWGHAISGLQWGAGVGIILKFLDTFIGLAIIDPTLAVLFLVAIGVCFIPRIGMIGVAIFIFFMIKFSNVNVNFFFMVIGAALAGASLGCLPGMAIGGIIGLSRKQSLARAMDASAEPQGILLKAVLLPLIGGIALFVFYFFVFNPWLVDLLQ